MMTLQTLARLVEVASATVVCHLKQQLPVASPKTWLLNDPPPVVIATQNLDGLLPGSLPLQIELCMSKSVLLLGFQVSLSVCVCMYACTCYLMATPGTYYSVFSLYNIENTSACLGMTVLIAAVMMRNYRQQLLPV